jgi:phage-related protein
MVWTPVTGTPRSTARISRGFALCRLLAQCRNRLGAWSGIARHNARAAEGGKADIAKPMHGMDSGIFEIALPFRSDAYRVIYAVQLAEEV